MMKLRSTVACLIVVLAGAIGQAQTVCPQCGRVHEVAAVANNGLQEQAQAEAQTMAARRFKGHVQGTLPGVGFCGVGWSSSSPNAPTCTPGGARQLLADAVARKEQTGGLVRLPATLVKTSFDAETQMAQRPPLLRTPGEQKRAEGLQVTTSSGEVEGHPQL